MTAWSKVTQIDASHFDAATAYVSVSRFRLDDLTPYVYRTRDGGRSWAKIVSGLPANAPVNVVREDPVRRGLLFCGTERAVWVSFDDGDHWQSLQRNLPATSMRDLVVHGNDLALATHGRSFWILDDITPLRQLARETGAAPVQLFRPAAAYRVRRDRNDDTPLPPEEPAGKNPPDGAVLDYVLGPSHRGAATLEIVDGEGRLVRRYSSEEPEKPVDPAGLVIPAYWVRPPVLLPAEPGMHRFVWDLREPPPDALDREYPISAIPGDTPPSPQGPIVPPGTYTVRLSAAGRVLSQPLEVRADPRVATSAADLRQAYQTARRIADAMRRDFRAIQEVRAVRARARELMARVGHGPAADALAAVESAAAELEGAGRGRARRPAGAPANLVVSNGRLVELLTMVDQADAAPLPAQLSALDEVEKDLDESLAHWSEVKTRELAAANAELSRAGLPRIQP
jgi:hypothetical protein